MPGGILPYGAGSTGWSQGLPHGGGGSRGYVREQVCVCGGREGGSASLIPWRGSTSF